MQNHGWSSDRLRVSFSHLLHETCQWFSLPNIVLRIDSQENFSRLTKRAQTQILRKIGNLKVIIRVLEFEKLDHLVQVTKERRLKSSQTVLNGSGAQFGHFLKKLLHLSLEVTGSLSYLLIGMFEQRTLLRFEQRIERFKALPYFSEFAAAQCVR